MHLQLEHEDGSRTAYFGICDFQTEGEQTRIAFHQDVSLEGDECYRSEDGEVVSAVSESGYNKEGAYETIGDLAIDDDVDVVVAVTDNYPWVAEAARRLKQEEDFDGEFELIE